MVQAVTHDQIGGRSVPFGSFGKHQHVAVRAQGRLALPPHGIGRTEVLAQRPPLVVVVPHRFKQIARPFAASWSVAVPRSGAGGEHHDLAVPAQCRRTLVHGRVHPRERHRRRPLAVVVRTRFEEIFPAHHARLAQFKRVREVRTGQDHARSAQVQGPIVFHGRSVQPPGTAVASSTGVSDARDACTNSSPACTHARRRTVSSGNCAGPKASSRASDSRPSSTLPSSH